MKIDFKNPYICTIIGLIVNGILVVAKFMLGIVGHSQAMVADSIHSLSDQFATVITYIALKISDNPADKKHPYGHGNAEVIVSWIVAILLFFTGAYLFYRSVHSIIHQHYSHPNMFAVIGALVSIILKEILYKYTIYVGKLLHSPVLKANAYDHRSDAITSVGALIGITGAIYKFPVLDSIAGFIISVFIIKIGLDIAKEAIDIIMHTLPPHELTDGVKKIINSMPEIKYFHKMRIHPVGRKHFMDVSIEVDKNLTVTQGHEIASALRIEIVKIFPHFSDVVIHTEPHFENKRDKK